MFDSAVAGKAPWGQRSHPWGVMTVGGPVDRAPQKAVGNKGHSCGMASEFYLNSRELHNSPAAVIAKGQRSS